MFRPLLPSWVSPASATPSHVSAKKHRHVDSEEVCGQFVQSLDLLSDSVGPVLHTRNPCLIHCHLCISFCFDLCVGSRNNTSNTSMSQENQKPKPTPQRTMRTVTLTCGSHAATDDVARHRRPFAPLSSTHRSSPTQSIFVLFPTTQIADDNHFVHVHELSAYSTPRCTLQSETDGSVGTSGKILHNLLHDTLPLVVSLLRLVVALFQLRHRLGD